MPFEVMVVAIVGIGCAYELGKRIVERVIQPRPDPVASSELSALRTEIATLREEVKSMRQENHDLMLAVDDLGITRRSQPLTPVENSTALAAGR